MQELGFEIELEAEFGEAVERVQEALARQGFGVLTSIDVQETLKRKLNASFRRYLIIGACNPVLAHQALSLLPESGLLLPCNVTVEEAELGGSLVRIINPAAMFDALGEQPALQPIADEAARLLHQAAAELRSSR